MTGRQNEELGAAAARPATTGYEAPSLTVIGSVVDLTQKGQGTDAMGSGNALGAGSGGSIP
jgi:hypothetical protein